MINIACVRVGNKYGIEYVERLRNMVQRHMSSVAYRIICLTDDPKPVDMVNMIDIREYELDGWWSKMCLLNPYIRSQYGNARTIYFDLDTVICGDLTPLINYNGQFGICENFSKLAGVDWPCSYGSCVMSLSPGFGYDVWKEFWRNKTFYQNQCGKHGDQLAIEYIWPHAELLQNSVPEGYFVGRRDFPSTKPDNASIMVFAGKHKPHNTDIEWLKEEWMR